MKALLTELGILDPITGTWQWRPRAGWDELKRSKDGRRMWAFGARVGYWPCVKAPHITVSFLFWRVDVWCGLPSYWDGAK